MLDRVHDHPCHPREHAVDDETRGVGDEDRPLTELLADGPHSRERVFARLGRAHDLEQRHERHGIEEVHPDDTLGMLQVGGHLGDR